MTLFSTVLKWMASAPPATNVAPMRPPNNACDELEGRPRYQVVRFHRIAPTSPAKITTGLMRVSSTSPPEIVLATCTDRKAPARFRQPASAAATLGRSAPVAIEVAMALAVSWKPLVKSKISAVSTTTTTITATFMCRASQASRVRPIVDDLGHGVEGLAGSHIDGAFDEVGSCRAVVPEPSGRTSLPRSKPDSHPVGSPLPPPGIAPAAPARSAAVGSLGPERAVSWSRRGSALVSSRSIVSRNRPTGSSTTTLETITCSPHVGPERPRVTPACEPIIMLSISELFHVARGRVIGAGLAGKHLTVLPVVDVPSGRQLPAPDSRQGS